MPTSKTNYRATRKNVLVVPAKFCKVCGTKLEGRRDKKYCNQSCKNQYHYEMRSLHHNEISAEMGFLLRNRTILHEILDQQASMKKKVSRDLLHFMGFRFECHTGTHVNHQGKMYRYVFDYSWMPFSDKEVLILRRNSKLSEG